MKALNAPLIGLAAAAIVALAVFSACGDDGDQDGEIRTESGLGVAMVAANAETARSRSAEAGQGGGAVAPEAPAAPSGDQRMFGYGVEQAPLMQQIANGITVSGYGTATAAADMAIVEFYFGSYSAAPGRAEEPAESGAPTGTTLAQITEEELRPVIDALVALGIAREDIQFLGSSYYYDVYWSSATLRVTVRDLGQVGAAVQAATEASRNLDEISLQSTYISYMVEDCGALERAALAAAIEDADQRADGFAAALGVTRGALTGAQTYAYSPFGGSPCGVGDIGPYPVAGIAYSESRASDVTLYANVTLTYAIE